MLQVSRGSIRDAIRGLELMGLVEPRQGAGTIVRERPAESPDNPFFNALKRRREMVADLLDFRKMLEPHWPHAQPRTLLPKKFWRWKRFCNGRMSSCPKGRSPSPRMRNFTTVLLWLPAIVSC